MSRGLFEVYKMVGAGNDFLFANLFDAKTKRAIAKTSKPIGRAHLAKNLCRRQQSLGADGFIFIEPSNTADFKWDFYNSDGSKAEMCGNASRCAVRFAKDILKLKNTSVSFETAAGIVTGKLLGKSRARVKLSAPKIHHEGLEVSANGKTWVGTFLNSGVPHFVVEAKFESRDQLNRASAEAIQKHKIFGREQTNVTFMDILKNNRARVVTFERGVKDFTLACGTGAIAAALALTAKTKVQDELYIEMPGGELVVEFDNNGGTSLEGEALLTSVMTVLKESFFNYDKGEA